MNLDTALLAFGIASLTIGLTLLTVYSSFGPGSKNLIDPFEEDDDQEKKNFYDLIIFGASRKKTAKKSTIKVPINKNV